MTSPWIRQRCGTRSRSSATSIEAPERRPRDTPSRVEQATPTPLISYVPSPTANSPRPQACVARESAPENVERWCTRRLIGAASNRPPGDRWSAWPTREILLASRSSLGATLAAQVRAEPDRPTRPIRRAGCARAGTPEGSQEVLLIDDLEHLGDGPLKNVVLQRDCAEWPPPNRTGSRTFDRQHRVPSSPGATDDAGRSWDDGRVHWSPCAGPGCTWRRRRTPPPQRRSACVGCPARIPACGSSPGHPGADAEVAVAAIGTRRRLAAARSYACCVAAAGSARSRGRRVVDNVVTRHRHRPQPSPSGDGRLSTVDGMSLPVDPAGESPRAGDAPAPVAHSVGDVVVCDTLTACALPSPRSTAGQVVSAKYVSPACTACARVLSTTRSGRSPAWSLTRRRVGSPVTGARRHAIEEVLREPALCTHSDHRRGQLDLREHFEDAALEPGPPAPAGRSPVTRPRPGSRRRLELGTFECLLITKYLPSAVQARDVERRLVRDG